MSRDATGLRVVDLYGGYRSEMRTLHVVKADNSSVFVRHGIRTHLLDVM